MEVICSIIADQIRSAQNSNSWDFSIFVLALIATTMSAANDTAEKVQAEAPSGHLD